MLFGQKGKVPDIGKDSFHHFMKQERDSVHNTNLTLTQKFSTRTNKQQTLNGVNQQVVNPLLPTQMLIDGSCKTSGNTWDAKHLDSFLKSSKFATVGEQLFKPSLQIPNPQQKTSFFLRNNQARLSEDKSAAHLFYSSQVNHLVTRTDQEVPSQENDKQEKQQFIQTKILSSPTKNYDAEKLYYGNQGPENQDENRYKVTLPSQRRNELIEAKQNIDEYQKWRKDHFDRNKSLRIAKSGFRSGIMNVDNPENPETLLYKEENENIKKNQNRSTENRKIREKNLVKYSNANPSIEFDNKNYKPLVDNAKDDLLKRDVLNFPHENFELGHDWYKKREVNLPYVNHKINTEDRLFGNNLKEIKYHNVTARAKYLRLMEDRGKNYNIICLTANNNLNE